jgi:pyridoxamine 5'-phosphate oxidase
VRAEGAVEPLSDAENDAYFRTRPWQSRLGAWASEQSQPVESRQALGRSVAAAARRFGIPYEGPGFPEPHDVAVDVPRPPNWGGYRLWADAVELWVEGEYRIHDRARWTRSLADRPGADSLWSVTRLQP